MDITAISDLHGFFPKDLPGGDLLIVAGDLTKSDQAWEYIDFGAWLNRQSYKKKVVIAGNHDNIAQNARPFIDPQSEEWEYLCDSGTEFENLKIFGSPWTLTFPGINPNCKAFTMDTEEELAEKWKLIPDDVDILITHGPPYGVLDAIKDHSGRIIKCVGSKSLQTELFERLNPKLFVCGHIHESYGTEPEGGYIKKAVNCSHVNERYEPVNKPIRIVL